MVETIIYNALDMLELNLKPEFYSFKELLSKILMLEFLVLDKNEKFDHYVGELQKIIPGLKENLTSNDLHVSNDTLTEKIKITEDLFYRLLLMPLDLSDEDIENMLDNPRNKGTLKTLQLLESGFESYLKKENTEPTFIEIFRKILEILAKYGFKTTNYIEVTVLRLMEFSVSPNRLIEKLNVEEQVAFHLENLNSNLPMSPYEEEQEISIETLTQNLFDWFIEHRQDQPPLIILKEILEKLEINVYDTSAFCHDIVYYFFLTIEEFLSQHRVNSVFYKFDNLDPNMSELANSPLSSSNLSLQILRPAKLGESPYYEKGFKYMICPWGFRDSSRFCYDRSVWLGKLDENIQENDIFLDETFLTQQLMVICGENGYYVCDYSQSGLAGRKLQADEMYELKKNCIFQLGSELIINVEDMTRTDNSFVVRMKVLKGCGLRGVCLFGLFKGNKSVIEIGRENCDVFINESSNNDKTVSRKHCKLILEDDKVFLQNFINSNGTYVNLKNFYEVEHRIPSDFYHITEQQDFFINGMLFRFTPQ